MKTLGNRITPTITAFVIFSISVTFDLRAVALAFLNISTCRFTLSSGYQDHRGDAILYIRPQVLKPLHSVLFLNLSTASEEMSYGAPRSHVSTKFRALSTFFRYSHHSCSIHLQSSSVKLRYVTVVDGWAHMLSDEPGQPPHLEWAGYDSLDSACK